MLLLGPLCPLFLPARRRVGWLRWSYPKATAGKGFPHQHLPAHLQAFPSEPRCPRWGRPPGASPSAGCHTLSGAWRTKPECVLAKRKPNPDTKRAFWSNYQFTENTGNGFEQHRDNQPNPKGRLHRTNDPGPPIKSIRKSGAGREGEELL